MPVEAQLFKSALAHWSSGVTVVTTCEAHQPIGITASSLTSVSLEPPRVLICVAKRLHTHQVIEQSGIFAVNILAVEQLAWGMRFAGLMHELEDRFAGIHWTTAVTGAPILPGVLAWLDCRLAQAYDGGDHTIFVGNVEEARVFPEREPLLYYSRHWRQLDPGLLHLE